MFSFSFNGIKKPYLKIEKGRRRSIFAPIKRNLVYVPGMAGAYLSDTDTDVRVIEQPIYIKSKTKPELRKLEEDLASWLITEEPAPLIFEDEPDRTYYAVVDGSLDIEEVVRNGKGIITFLCPDPYKYGPEKEVTFESSTSFDVEGTVETEPVIEVTLKADTEYVAVSNGTDINMVGFPAKQEEIVTEWQTPIFITSGQTLTGWTVSSDESAQGTPIMGALKSDGNHFYADDYGDDPYHWHGPAMKTSLSESLTDFRFDAGFLMRSTGGEQCGSVEIAILDANSQILCEFQMTKHYQGLNKYYARVTAKGHDIIPESQVQFDNNFQGVFRLYRQGTRWESFIWMVEDSGVWNLKGHNVWNDTNSVATAKATQVQMRLLQRANFPVCEQWIDDIQVYRLNDLDTNQVPIIGKAGDKVIFDHVNDNIMLNGESIIDKKAFIGNYFKLKSGRNSIALEPADKIEKARLKYLPKYR